VAVVPSGPNWTPPPTIPIFFQLSHYAKSRKVAVSIPEVVGFFSLPNSSSRTMAMESTQPLTEMSTRNLPGRVKGGRPARRADNLTAICEVIV
jgi:hypothetical protein